MTLKNIRAPLLSIIKLCASYHHHMCIQTGVMVPKRLSWVLTPVTLTFDLWPFEWISLLSLVITPYSHPILHYSFLTQVFQIYYFISKVLSLKLNWGDPPPCKPSDQYGFFLWFHAVFNPLSLNQTPILKEKYHMEAHVTRVLTT